MGMPFITRNQARGSCVHVLLIRVIREVGPPQHRSYEDADKGQSTGSQPDRYFGMGY